MSVGRFGIARTGAAQSASGNRAVMVGALPMRLLRFLEAALARRGDLRARGRRRVRMRRIAELRRLGIVRRVTLFDPVVCGRPVECLTLVRLAAPTGFCVDAFESRCRADRAVTTATAVHGRFHYQLASWHTDPGAAEIWRRGLLGCPHVAAAEQRIVRTIKGCQLRSVPLRLGLF